MSRRRRSSSVRLDLEGNDLVLTSPYHAGFVAAFKSNIPATGRTWDGQRKVWFIDYQYGAAVVQLIGLYYNQAVFLPPPPQVTPTTEQRIYEIRYLGACKDRGEAEPTAFGNSGGAWSVVFPESVLQEFFDGGLSGDTPAAQVATTLYALLGIARQATSEDIKAGFRRMARQWHPDVCQEPDAQDRFIEIKEAYDILSDVGKRARYDAGLALEATLRRQASTNVADYLQSSTYRPGLRCGWLIVEGVEKLGRFIVSKIVRWDDITDSYGRTLVTSWPAGADHWVEVWV